MATIKEQLLADITANADSRGRLTISLFALAKRNGLNPHDLQKNLFQLEREGVLRLRSGKGKPPPGESGSFEVKRVQLNLGRLSTARLEDGDLEAKRGDHPTTRSITGPTKRVHGVGPDVLNPRTYPKETTGGPVTSTWGPNARPHSEQARKRRVKEKAGGLLVPGSFPARIMAVLRAMAPDPTGWIDVDNGMLQQRLGLSQQNVATAMLSLEKQGHIERLREGQRIIGVRLLNPVPQVDHIAPPPGETTVVVMTPEAHAEVHHTILEEMAIPPTPLLDAYVAAKKAAEANPNWLRFEPDPLAEEALRLRAAVAKLYLERYK
jgi:hypothetical protein